MGNGLAFKDYVADKITDFTVGTYPFALCIIDLDRFKKTTDRIGKANGDDIIKEIGSRLGDLDLQTEILSRIGSDRFGLVITIKDSLNDTQQLLNELPKVFHDGFEIYGSNFSVTGSCGITLYPYDGKTYDELMDNANTALKDAKKNGCNICRIFDIGLKDSQDLKNSILSHLHSALDYNEIIVHYCPEVAPDGRVMKLQASMHWNSPAYGVVEPDVLLPLLDETGLIIDYGKRLINESLTALKTFHNGCGDDLVVTIRISPLQFKSADFVLDIMESLSEHHMLPENLELEISAHEFTDDYDLAAATIKQLSIYGVSVALVDFISGPLSLNHLMTLPIDVLKLDRKFVSNILDGNEEA